MEALIELSEARKAYPLGDGRRVEVLQGVDLTIHKGERLALMGPSGSGKSTLMNILGLLDTLDSGAYRLAGADVKGLSEAALANVRGRRIGFVFQSFHLLPRATALANVMLPMRYVAGKIDPNRAGALLERVGLGSRGHHTPEQLSGGERQRVAIARALVNQPDIILADEPTGNLDSESGTAVLNLLLDLNQQGLTLVIVTHDEAVARRTPRIIRMKDGRVTDL